jgi:dihydroflavonol-4-reductase
MIVEAAAGRMPAYVDTGLNIVHVDDVAMGHWLAFERGKVGERYILGGENLGLGNILAIVANLLNHKPPTLRLPILPLFPLAFIMEIMAHVTGKEPMLSMDALRMAQKKMFFTAAKAERELGFTARPAKVAISDAFTWFRSNGYC